MDGSLGKFYCKMIGTYAFGLFQPSPGASDCEGVSSIFNFIESGFNFNYTFQKYWVQSIEDHFNQETILK